MKTNLFKSAVLATSLVMALTACSDKKSNNNDTNKNIHADAQMSSEDLTDAGEQLVSPYTFMLADKIMDMAVQKDPSNTKAQFYHIFLERMMVFKGIAKRIHPLVKQGSAQQQQDYDKWIKTFPESPMKKFLLDGPEDIQTYSQLQNVLANYQQALNDFRKFLKANQAMQLTLNLNPHVFEKEINEEMANSCVYVEGPDHQYDVQCDMSGIAQKKINAADIVALRQIVGGEMLYYAMLNSYDLSTIEQVTRANQNKQLTPQQTLDMYKALPSVAKLRKDQMLSLVPELGADFSAAAKWAIQYQSSICPKGNGPIGNQRPGFLFKNGLCVDNISDTQKSLAILDQVLSGIYTAPIKDDQGNTTDQIRVNLIGFLMNPPKDLKTVMPDAVDQDGHVTRFSDNTISGLFPDGDVQKLNKQKN